ncbi:MAG: FxsA family protein [Actinobacteria bacterium]|nr:FxsA family protein [Actinomycetota bacterium]
MFLVLLALFIIIPLLELWMIIEVGSRIGVVYTILSLILISVAGAALAKQQGYRVIARIQSEVQSGNMPGDSLVDGALILAGAILLLTPGFLTDIVGLLLLLPVTRIPVRSFAKRRLKIAVERRSIFIWSPGGRGGPGDGTGFGGGPGGPGSGPEEPREPEQRRKELED